MKINYFGILASVAVLFSACGGGKPTPQEEIKQYVSDFIRVTQLGNEDSIAAYYAGAKGAKILPIKVTTENIEVSEPDTNGEVKVTLADKELFIKYTPEKIEILNSKKLFDYSKEDMKFARQTGMIDNDMPDVEINTRMADTTFRAWLIPYIAQKVKNNVTPGAFKSRWVQGPFEGENVAECVINNANTVDIDGNDYSFRFKVACQYEIPPSVDYVVEKGKTLPAGGSVKYTEGGGTDDCTTSGQTIVWKIKDSEIVSKYGQYDGTEYAAYLKTLTAE